jgi:uncharacterized protein (TIGR03435 family)
MHRPTSTGLALAAIVTGVAVFAQAPAPLPSFEVASVRPNTSGDGRVMMSIQPGGRFTATNVQLRVLIRSAFSIQDFQIVDAPDWARDARYDVVAKAASDLQLGPTGGAPGPGQLMLQSLLAERFNLRAHMETREMPIYALVPARADGRLGPQLRRSDVDCDAVFAARRGGAPPPPPTGIERPQCGVRFGPGSISGGMPMRQLAGTLSNVVQRIVVDRTGLTGDYALDLTYTPEQLPQGPPPAGAPPPPPIDPNGPSIFTAVQEQLGLKLESARGPVEVLVIDRLERPTPD